MFTITVTPTKLQPNGIPHYLATARIEGRYEPVLAIAMSHRDAIAAVLIKVEAAMVAKERRNIIEIEIECRCCCID